VERPRVSERLARASRFPVTLIAAPAGFGKSLALRDFVAASNADAILCELRREDGTLLAFVRRLSEALEPVAPTAMASFRAMQERVLASKEPVRQLSDWFAEHLKDAACTLVIDDLHFAAAEPASMALLADLIERTGGRITWIVAARSDAGLPVASWIAYGRMDMPIGEDDLRFTTEEALAAAAASGVGIEAPEVESLRQLTEGWPVALTIALRTRTHARDLRSASLGTREMIYRYLAEQIFAGLTDEQRHFALASCVFPGFDAETARKLGATPEFMAELRRTVTFLNEASPGTYRYHDLFRDFLEAELRRGGEALWRRSLNRAAAFLEARDHLADALELYAKARARERLAPLLESHGFALLERGEAAAVASALDVLQEAGKYESAAALGLRATIDANLGRFSAAEPGFLHAIAAAEKDDRLRAKLVHRYATELVRNDRDCVAFLEPFAFDDRLETGLRLPMLGTLATGYVRTGRGGDAVRTADRALSVIEEAADDGARAMLYQQAAYVHRYAGSAEASAGYADLAVELALKAGQFEVAARAYSVLYTIAHDRSDDPIRSLAILERMSECARKAASSQPRVFALMASYEIQVERGDDAALADLDSAIDENRVSLPRVQSTALLPALAMRAAWSGDFAAALDLLAGTEESQRTAEQRALRCSEIALYAAACGEPQVAQTAAAQAAPALQDGKNPSRRSLRARLFLALAEMVRGHSAEAHRWISEAERSTPAQLSRLRTFASAVRALYRLHLRQADREPLDAALRRLREQHFGGLARLIEALPPAAAAEGSYAALTPSEREILVLLSAGASTKDVAARTGRSPHTVDTHIRAICRKLNCSGRREAVALATSRGWVQR
jgi:LuxR family maltose regulon positive regulatory protein